MKANALILTEAHLKDGADKEDPELKDFDLPKGMKAGLAKLNFVAYAYDGKLKVLKFREGMPGVYEMTFGEYVAAKNKEGAYA